MPTIHLFVDTNVWVSFFAFAKDDIDQLTKLTGLINNDRLKLYVPEQVAHEFARNREVKLAKSIKEFSEGFSKAVPRFLIDLDEAKAFKKVVEELAKARNDLVQKAKDGAVSKTFAVDTLVADVFAAATIGDVTGVMIDKARLRKDIGNPPGKGQSLGDQINWEYLLATVPKNVDLHIVSKDGDYQSALKNGLPHNYLAEEWHSSKKSHLHLHTELKPFLNAQFDIIQLQVDKEKSEAIKLLSESGSFATTHIGVSMVSSFFDALNAEDANYLVEHALANPQIRWIAMDSDVNELFNKIIESFAGQFIGSLEEEAKTTFNQKIEDEF